MLPSQNQQAILFDDYTARFRESLFVEIVIMFSVFGCSIL